MIFMVILCDGYTHTRGELLIHHTYIVNVLLYILYIFEIGETSVVCRLRKMIIAIDRFIWFVWQFSD